MVVGVVTPRLDRYGDPIDSEPEPDVSALDLSQLDHGVNGCEGTVTVRLGATCAVLTCLGCHRLAVVQLHPNTPAKDHTPNTPRREDR